MITGFVVRRPGALVLLMGSVLLTVWAFALAVDITMRPTPLAIILDIAHDFGLAIQTVGVCMIFVAGSTLNALVQMKRMPRQRFFYAVIPQQLVLVAATWGPLRAVWLGIYADGVQCCSRAHILVDQLPMVIFVFMHIVGVLACLRNR